MATKDPKPTKVPVHEFDPDPELVEYEPIPRRAESRELRHYCRTCGLLGEPDDARHSVAADLEPEDPRVVEAWRAHDDAVLGERDALGGEAP